MLSDSENDTCNYPRHVQFDPKHECHSQIVRLEPLVDWGTVTPSKPLHFMLPFRRDGVFVTDRVEYPGYAKLVEGATANAPAYCVGCLGHLWSERGEGREAVGQMRSTIPAHDREMVPRPQSAEKTAPRTQSGTPEKTLPQSISRPKPEPVLEGTAADEAHDRFDKVSRHSFTCRHVADSKPAPTTGRDV